MKKALIFLLVIIFIACAVLGFNAMSKLSKGNKAPDDTKPATAIKDTQQNYLLIHVTDLESKDPQLVSVWGVFTFYSSPPQLVFIPFIPSADDTVQSSLLSSFKITNSSTVTSRFISQVEEQFQVKTSGYLMIDNAGLSEVRKWMGMDDSSVSARTPQSADEEHIVLYNGQLFFKSFCKQAGAQGIASVFEKIRWLDILPTHFSTNLTFESATMATELLGSTNTIQLCEVLSEE